MKKGNIVFALLLLICMSYLLTLTFSIPEPLDQRQIGAGYVPMLYISISIILLISIIVGTAKSEMKEKFDFDFKTIGYLGVIIGYVVAINYIGYYVSTLLTIFLLLFMLGERRKTVLFSIPIGFITFIYAVFVRIMKLRI